MVLLGQERTTESTRLPGRLRVALLLQIDSHQTYGGAFPHVDSGLRYSVENERGRAKRGYLRRSCHGS